MKRGFLNGSKATGKQKLLEIKTSIQLSNATTTDQKYAPQPQIKAKAEIEKKSGNIDVALTDARPKTPPPPPAEFTMKQFLQEGVSPLLKTIEIATIPPRPRPKDDVASGLIEETDPDGHTEFISHIKTPIPKHLSKPNVQLEPVPKTPKKNYIIRNTPNMGKGIFATREIKAYDLVFAERPILITHSGMVPPIYIGGNKGIAGPMSVENTRKMENYAVSFLVAYEAQLQGALDRMKKEDKQNFMDLTHVSTFGKKWGPLAQRIQTNAFGITGLDTTNDKPKHYSGIGKDASFMNHSCAPNVFQNFNLPSLSLIFIAVRDIKKGEQIFYSYTDIYQPAVARQQDVSKYGFRCTCKACTGDTSEIDKFRTTLSETLAKLYAYQKRILRNPLVTEKALDPVYRFKADAIKAGVDTYDVDKIILETLEMLNERKGDGKEVLRLREEKARLQRFFED